MAASDQRAGLPACESCGATADVRLGDGSTWCDGCNAAAHNLDYDQEEGVRTVPYDRGVLVNVLVYHWRTTSSGCGCGWAELGRLWPEHVAEVYEESVLANV